jgi:hypothetical protein
VREEDADMMMILLVQKRTNKAWYWITCKGKWPRTVRTISTAESKKCS